MNGATRKRSTKFSYILLHLAGEAFQSGSRRELRDAMDEAGGVLGINVWIQPVGHGNRSTLRGIQLRQMVEFQACASYVLQVAIERAYGSPLYDCAETH